MRSFLPLLASFLVFPIAQKNGGKLVSKTLSALACSLLLSSSFPNVAAARLPLSVETNRFRFSLQQASTGSPTPETVTPCAVPTPLDNRLPIPKITAANSGSSSTGKISGEIQLGSGISGTVFVCADGKPLSAGDVSSTQKTFGGNINLTRGQKITAQFEETEPEANVYGLASSAVIVDSCQLAATSKTNKTTLAITITDASKSQVSLKGTVSGATDGKVRICVADLPVSDPASGGDLSIDVGSDGSFSSAQPLTVKAGDTLVAQYQGKNSSEWSSLSQQQQILAGDIKIGSTSATSGGSDTSSTSIFIGGVEQSGYSSLGLNTNAFVYAFIEGPRSKRLNGWGRVRLMSTPQASTQGIVGSFSNPTGLTTQDYTKVGQALDVMAGPRLRISKRWAAIADFGFTTPLNSQSVSLTYVVPAAGTQECTTLASRFTVQNGYSPGVTAAPAGSSTCLTGGYTDIAFTNQDRSNFLLKYSGGFRTTNTFACKSNTNCADSYGMLDLTFGQDAAYTRGILRHVVFKLDGVLPIPTGGSSYFYIFGSVALRLAKGQDLSPLILQAAPSTVTVPSASVIVLPLLIPDRDFYRIGVGLNLNQIFCKTFGGTCSTNSSNGTTNQSTSTTKTGSS